MERTFHQHWPAADAEVVDPRRLRDIVLRTTEELERVLRTLQKRLDWCLGQMERLDGERRRGTLDRDEDALYTRCDRLVKRLKGLEQRRRYEAEGYDDTNTFGVLAVEGFLPGYGLETGAIVGTAFSLPVAVYGYELERHGQGCRFARGGRDLTFRRGVHLRLVNVGAVPLVSEGQLGYPVCLVSGQSRSPFASQRERDEFSQHQQERYGRPVESVGFFADVVADALGLSGCPNRDKEFIRVNRGRLDVFSHEGCGTIAEDSETFQS